MQASGVKGEREKACRVRRVAAGTRGVVTDGWRGAEKTSSQCNTRSAVKQRNSAETDAKVRSGRLNRCATFPKPRENGAAEESGNCGTIA